MAPVWRALQILSRRQSKKYIAGKFFSAENKEKAGRQR